MRADRHDPDRTTTKSLQYLHATNQLDFSHAARNFSRVGSWRCLADRQDELCFAKGRAFGLVSEDATIAAYDHPRRAIFGQDRDPLCVGCCRLKSRVFVVMLNLVVALQSAIILAR